MKPLVVWLTQFCRYLWRLMWWGRIRPQAYGCKSGGGPTWALLEAYRDRRSARHWKPRR